MSEKRDPQNSGTEADTETTVDAHRQTSVHGNVKTLNQIGKVYGNVSIITKQLSVIGIIACSIILVSGRPLFFWYQHRNDKVTFVVTPSTDLVKAKPNPKKDHTGLTHNAHKLKVSVAAKLNKFREASAGEPADGDAEGIDKETTLRYAYDRLNDKVVIRPKMPYLMAVEQGGTVNDVGGEFNWHFPSLSVQTQNNTGQSLLLTDMIVNVKKSNVITDPILLFTGLLNEFVIYNDGWGPALNPTITFGFVPIPQSPSETPDTASTDYSGLRPGRMQFSRKLENIPPDTEIGFSVRKYIPAKYIPEKQPMFMFGLVKYTDQNGKQRQLNFRVMVNWEGGAGNEPTKLDYDVYLKAGKTGPLDPFPLHRTIKSGDADNITFRVIADKSTHYDLDLSFRSSDGEEIGRKAVDMDIFVSHDAAPIGGSVRYGPEDAGGMGILDEPVNYVKSKHLRVKRVKASSP